VGRKTWYASIIVLVLGLMVDAYTLNWSGTLGMLFRRGDTF
jgi:hypothetical protein